MRARGGLADCSPPLARLGTNRHGDRHGVLLRGRRSKSRGGSPSREIRANTASRPFKGLIRRIAFDAGQRRLQRHRSFNHRTPIGHPPPGGCDTSPPIRHVRTTIVIVIVIVSHRRTTAEGPSLASALRDTVVARCGEDRCEVCALANDGLRLSWLTGAAAMVPVQ